MHSPVSTRSNREGSVILLHATIERCNNWSIAFDFTDKFIARGSEMRLTTETLLENVCRKQGRDGTGSDSGCCMRFLLP